MLKDLFPLGHDYYTYCTQNAIRRNCLSDRRMPLQKALRCRISASKKAINTEIKAQCSQ